MGDKTNLSCDIQDLNLRVMKIDASIEEEVNRILKVFDTHLVSLTAGITMTASYVRWSLDPAVSVRPVEELLQNNQVHPEDFILHLNLLTPPLLLADPFLGKH